MLEDIIGALDLVFAWENFFWAFIGVLCGAIMGSIPGLTDTMAIVLLLPFTYYLGPIPGIAMLMGFPREEISAVLCPLFYSIFPVRRRLCALPLTGTRSQDKERAEKPCRRLFIPLYWPMLCPIWC